METPLPLTAAVGAFLLLRPKLPRGTGVLLAWALLPILGNAFYWFHGARMYFEAAPAWITLGVLAVVEGSRAASEGPGSSDSSAVIDDQPASMALRGLGPFVGWAALLALGWSVFGGTPSRWSNAAWAEETLERVTMPELPEGGSALVFVHTTWSERLSAALQGAGGMRQDTVTSALRRNATCALDRYARAREHQVRGGGFAGPLPPLDLAQEPGVPSGVELLRLGNGAPIRVRSGEPVGPECARELHADRFGSVALAPLLWQGDLPGDERGRPMFVRDLGPEKNEVIRAAFPERRSYVFGPMAPGEPPRVTPYDDAMRMLWAPR